MPKCVHNINAEFDLRYSGKKTIKLEPHLCIYINLKVALKIPATTMVQLASRNSLAKKGINIRKEIIDARYIRNIITMLQNDLKKAYIIELNKKIAQTIFLLLVKIAQLISIENKEKLGITAREISRFESMCRINVPVNMAEEKYMLAIEKKVKNQAQMFEAEAAICESEKVELTNFYIPAKSLKHIKIPIYNITEDIIEITKEITIKYLSTKVKEQPPNSIPVFPQLCKYVDIILQTIYGQKKCLFTLIRTIKTDKLEKFRLTTTYAAEDITQQL
ncbi:hypothetical protein G9A89_003803 [Geosiphon pyriformis]|nr:hypothetical protein G9A89_003803 [Geosiphon pyriformis]